MFKTLEAEVLKNCTPLWREARLEVKMLNTTCSRHFWTLKRRFAWQAKRILHPAKNLIQSEQNVRVLYQFQKRWQAWDIWRRSAKMPFLHSRRNTRDTWVRYVRRSGRWFPERGCILEPQIFRFAKMILRDRCSTSYDLASLFRGKRNALDRWTGKIKKRIGTRLPALHSTFHCWRESRRSASFLMLSTWKFEEISQTRFVFDTVKFNKLWWYPQQPQRFIFTNLSEECCEAKRWETQTFSGPSPRPSPETLEPHLALHQSLPRPSPEPSSEPCWAWPGSASKPPRPSPEPSLGPCWTWPGSAPKPPRPSPEPSLEPSPGPCWTWLGFAPRLPGTFSGTFCWTWPGSAPKPPRPSPEPSPEPSAEPVELTWLCTKASGHILRNLLRHPVEPDLAAPKPPKPFQNRLQNPVTWLSTKLLRNSVEPDLALHQSLPDLLRNLLQNPVEPDPALHQSLPQPSPEHSSEPCWKRDRAKTSQTFSGTFSWVPVEPDLARHRSLPDLHRNLLRNPVEPDLALHQSLPDLLRNLHWNFLRVPAEPWPGSPPNPPRPSPEHFLEPSPEPCWTWLGFAPRLPGTVSGTLLNLTWLCTKASQTFFGTFGTFCGTSLNLTRCLHQCTPGLFWDEDPISLRCWGKIEAVS